MNRVRSTCHSVVLSITVATLGVAHLGVATQRYDPMALSGCLQQSAWARQTLSSIGLKPGSAVRVAVREEHIPDINRGSVQTNLLILTADGQRGFLFFLDRAADASLELKLNAYSLTKSRDGWAAGEGNGGVGTYRAIGRYVDSIPATQITSGELGSNDDCPVNATPVDMVVVHKAARTLTLSARGRSVKVYKIALGRNPVGHKQQEGDGRTPEGRYVIDFRKRDSAFHRALHISYPNVDDRARARRRGVSPGGAIMIHGLKNGFGAVGAAHRLRDWTDGCIAVTNPEIEEIWRLVRDGTPIEIRP
jgi:hypothetical protein